MNKKILFAVFAFIFIAPIFSSKTFALIPLIDPNKKIVLPCVTRANKIGTRIDAIKDKKADDKEQYSILKDRLSQYISKWESFGFDVDDLEDDLSTLDQKIDKFEDDFDDFISKLDDAKESTCNTTDFDDAFEDAKTALQQVKQDASEIRSFYQNTIRPHILDLKDQEL